MKKNFLAVALMIFSALLAVPAQAQGLWGKHLAASTRFVVAVQQDGTVRAVGSNDFGQCETSSWRDVMAISANRNHVLGLKRDGTVYAAGDNRGGQCDVSGWTDIVMVATSYSTSFGLKEDGAIVYTQNFDAQWQEEIKGWKDIVWIDAAGDCKLFAIDRNGKAYGVGMNFSRLANVVQITANNEEVYNFLLSDGTLRLMTPYDEYSEVVDMDFPKYVGLCAIADATWVFMALNQDGTVASDSALPYFASWTGVIEIAGGYGVKADGSILTEKEFCQEMTPDQLAEIHAWRVMVDPGTLPAGKPGAP